MAMEDETDRAVDVVPASPSGRILSWAEINICIHVSLQLHSTVEVANLKHLIRTVFLPKERRLSSLLLDHEKGRDATWTLTAVNVDEHVIVPEFPVGPAIYDDVVAQYFSELHLRPLPRDRPPWQFHVINYPTTSSAATMILSLDHRVGDGTSLISLALACADQPNPAAAVADGDDLEMDTSAATRQPILPCIRTWWHTIAGLIDNAATGTCLADSNSPLRAPPEVALVPKEFASATFSLQDLRKLKERVHGTVNDVLMGIVFYAVQSYVRSVGVNGGNTSNVAAEIAKMRITALGLIDTRGQQTQQGKSKPEWGNRYWFTPIRIPMREMQRPLDYVWAAKRMMDGRKISNAAKLTTKLLGFLSKATPKISSMSYKLMDATLKNTSFTVTNVVGPAQMTSVGGIAAKGVFFSLSGVPHSLAVNIISYAGDVTVEIVTAKGYVDAHLLSHFICSCYQRIKDDHGSS